MAGRASAKSRKDALLSSLTETGERRFTYGFIAIVFACIWGIWGWLPLLLTVITGVLVWIFWTRLNPSHLFMIVLEKTGIDGAPWHRILRLRYVNRWQHCADYVGLERSKVVKSWADNIGVTLRLRLRKGQTIDDVLSRLKEIESALGVRRGAVRAWPEEGNAGRCYLRIIVHDKLANPIPWPGPAISTITKPIPIGLWEDQTEIFINMLGGHILIGGMTGSGKSCLLSVILGNLVNCDDVALLGIDQKGGVEFTSWENVFEELATEADEALGLLEAANRIHDARAQWLRQNKLKQWHPTPSEPALFVVVDELAELSEEAHKQVDRLARLGRATCVQLILATQRPSQEALGSINVRTQLGTRIALRVAESGDNNLILGPGRSAEGWRAERLGPRGSLLVLSDEQQQPRPGRAYYVPVPEPPARPAGRLDSLSAQAAG